MRQKAVMPYKIWNEEQFLMEIKQRFNSTCDLIFCKEQGTAVSPTSSLVRPTSEATADFVQKVTMFRAAVNEVRLPSVRRS